MSTRKVIYNTWCVTSSFIESAKRSKTMAQDSLCQWFKASPLVDSVFGDQKWYYDKDWERARALSNRMRDERESSGYGGVFSSGQSVRHFSTVSRANKQSQRKITKNTNDNNNGNDGSDGNDVSEEIADSERELKSSEVPSSRLSRLFHYSSLATGVGLNVAKQSISDVARGKKPDFRSLILSESNIDRITEKFSKMRGAALKVGQMMSYQDEKVLPKELYEILSRVQNNANYMPQRQLEKVMKANLGDGWKTRFKSFDNVPIAAASIGQVHYAELIDGTRVVVKVQYPGVKQSIDSDLSNILMLLTASRLLPKGLFLDKTVANARKELKWECDYLREATAQQKFSELLADDPVFVVPRVYSELTTENVLTMDRMEGIEIMNLPDATTSQETRNFICESIMRLCLQEIATFQYMQTDPNWANFMYNDKTRKIGLLDFGASRPFPSEFIKDYRKLLTYATLNDRANVERMSVKLGYLNGFESAAMTKAHVDSVMTLGEPFSGDTSKAFDFKEQTVSTRIRGNIGLMLNERLCPPPEETYSLHRKFSGVFLLCAKMGASVHCAKLFQEYFALTD